MFVVAGRWGLGGPVHMASSPQRRGLRCDVAAIDELRVSFDYIKRRFFALAPEANVKLVLADAKITDGKIRQPGGKERVDIELVARSVRQESQQGLREHEHRASRPSLRHVRAKILHWEIRLIALARLNFNDIGKVASKRNLKLKTNRLHAVIGNVEIFVHAAVD